MNFDKIWLIIDLEATCWEDGIMPNGERQSVDTMEVIEIGCAIAKENGELLHSRFIPVRPTENPILTPFCTSLTSITQDMVNDALSLDLVISDMNKYVQEYEIAGWCSWGDYDRRMFEAQTKRFGCYLDLLSFPHVNIKKLWAASTGYSKKRSGLMNALEHHGLEFEGHYHRGIDDARNMAKLMPFMNWDLKEQFTTPGQPQKYETYAGEITCVEFAHLYTGDEVKIHIKAVVVHDILGRYHQGSWIVLSALQNALYNDELKCWEFYTRSRHVYHYKAPRDEVISHYHFKSTRAVVNMLQSHRSCEEIAQIYPDHVVDFRQH